MVIAAVLVLAFLLHSWSFKVQNLPPGPKGFPMFGSLHLIGKLPHRDLHNLSQRYGSIMHMKLGLVHTIIVSSPHAAELFLKTHDRVFASRPLIHTSKIISYGQKDLVFAPYGSYWRNIRKMCTLELFSPLKISSFKSMRFEEVGELIEYLKTASKDGVVVGLSSKVSSLSADMTCLMVFGKKYRDEEFGERGFKAVIQEAMQLAIAPNLADYIPFLALFDVQGLNRRAKFVGKEFDGFLERIIEEHIQSKDGNRSKDFVDAMLDLMMSSQGTHEYQIHRSNIKAIALVSTFLSILYILYRLIFLGQFESHITLNLNILRFYLKIILANTIKESLMKLSYLTRLRVGRPNTSLVHNFLYMYKTSLNAWINLCHSISDRD